MSFDIRPASEFTPASKGRLSPAEQLVAEINEDRRKEDQYYTIRQCADILGINLETTRRVVVDAEKQPSASDVIVRGKNWHIWLLLDKDLADLGRYFGAAQVVLDHFKAKYKGRVPKALSERLKEA